MSNHYFHHFRFFGIPQDILPKIKSSAEVYGTIVSVIWILNNRIHVSQAFAWCYVDFVLFTHAGGGKAKRSTHLWGKLVLVIWNCWKIVCNEQNVRGQLIEGFLLLIAVLGWHTGCVSCPAVFLCGWGQAHLWYWLLPAVQHRTGTNIPFFAPSPILHSLFTISVIKAWIGKFPCALYVSMEMIAHATVFHVIVVSSTCGTDA